MKKIGLIVILAFSLAVLAGTYLFFKSGSNLSITRVKRGSEEVAMAFGESPTLTKLVEKGELPPVKERLPVIPLLVQPEEEIGVYGGIWRIAMRSKNDHASFIRNLGYENLVRWNTAWTGIVPNIAQTYEASPDGKEYTFRLRHGMKWSDGEPFTADDIIFWYENVLSNPELTVAPPAWLVTEGIPVVVEKIDPLTVRFKFASPNGLFITSLAHPQGAEPTSYPKHYLSQFLPKFNPDVASLAAAEGVKDWRELFKKKFGTVGSIDSMDRWQNPELPVLNAWALTGRYGVDTTIVARRNPYYWKTDTAGNQLPYIDEISYTVTDDAEAMLSLALKGELDMQDRHIGNSALSIIANKARLDTNRVSGAYRFFQTVPANMNTLGISLNLNHKDPVVRKLFQEKNFRIAFSEAIDRREIITKALGGIGEPYQMAPRPESPFYDAQMAKQYTERDVADANRLLDELGLAKRDAGGWRLLADGRRLSIRLDTNADALPVELIAAQLKEVGVEVKPTVMADRQAFYDRKNANDQDAVIWPGDGGLDVIQEPRYYFPFSSESNYALQWAKRYYEPGGEADGEVPEAARRQQDLYREIVATPDQTKQTELMKQILAIAKEQFYAIGVSLTGQTYGIVKNGFGNVPKVMPAGWVYPNPAPTNPCQYFIKP